MEGVVVELPDSRRDPRATQSEPVDDQTPDTPAISCCWRCRKIIVVAAGTLLTVATLLIIDASIPDPWSHSGNEGQWST